MAGKDLKEKLVSVIFLIILEVFAGVAMLGGGEYLVRIPIFFMLIPALMDLRGDIMGPYGFRLMTSLHLGTNKPKFATRYNLVNSVVAISLMIISSLIVVGSVSALALLLHIPMYDLGVLTLLALMTTLISALIMIPVIIIFTNVLFIRGYNVENFLPSLITGSMDALTPSILFASFILVDSLSQETRLGLTVTIVAMSLAGVLFVYREGREELMKDFKENLSISAVVATLSGVGGSFFSRSPGVAIRTGFVAFIPALNSLIGSVLGMLAGKLSISIHMTGVIKLKEMISDLKDLILASEVGIVFLAAMFSLLSSLPTIPGIAAVSVATAMIATVIMIASVSVVVYALTQYSFKLGLNPNNLVFPVITSIADLVTPMISFAILTLLASV